MNDIIGKTDYMDVDEWRIIIQRRQNIKDSTPEVCNTVERLKETALAAFVDKDSEASDFYRSFTKENLFGIYDGGRRHIAMEYLRRMPDGTKRRMENQVWFMLNPDNGHLCIMLIARDIDPEKKKTMELAEAAERDEMTGVLNRASTVKHIVEVLKTGKGCHALFIIDPDYFKSLNDTPGHQAGDECLIEFAKMLKSCFGDGDIIGRIGGDEFFVLMKDRNDKDSVKDKADSFIDAGRKLCKKYPTVPLSMSMGISMYPENGRMLKELYGKSDEALYKAKRDGKDRYVFAKQRTNKSTCKFTGAFCLHK